MNDTSDEIIQLQLQLEEIKLQDRLLEDIEIKLHEMKEIAQYVHDHTLSKAESIKLNESVQKLQGEIKELEKALSNK